MPSLLIDPKSAAVNLITPNINDIFLVGIVLLRCDRCIIYAILVLYSILLLFYENGEKIGLIVIGTPIRSDARQQALVLSQGINKTEMNGTKVLAPLSSSSQQMPSHLIGVRSTSKKKTAQALYLSPHQIRLISFLTNKSGAPLVVVLVGATKLVFRVCD